MNIEELREYCLSKTAAIECLPFDEHTLVFKVMNKMFALIPLEKDLQINLKCSPDKINDLREHYPCVQIGYHMSKNHWNTVIIDGSVDDKTIYQWVDDSYNLVVDKLTKKQKEELSKLRPPQNYQD